MTVLNFPPTAGEATDGSFQYTENNITYVWNGSYWSSANAANGDFDARYLNSTGPETLTGDLTITGDLDLGVAQGANTVDVTAGTLYIITGNADPVAPGQFTTLGAPDGNIGTTFLATGTGTLSGGNTVATAQTGGDITTEGDYSGADGTFSGDLTVGGDITLTGGSTITGDVVIDGDLEVNDLTINGETTLDGEVLVTNLNGGQLAGFRNFIINGDFRVFQRGADERGAGTGGARRYTGPDHFFKFNNGDRTQQIDTSSDDFGGVTGLFPHACRLSGGQNSRIFGQCIEGPLPAGDVTYSAWVRFSEQPTQCYMTTHSIPLVGLNDFSGFYGGSGTNQVYVNPDGWDDIYPGDNIWFKIQRTFTPASPELGLGVGFQPIFSAATNATFDVTGVQVELGSVATPFEHRSIGTELALCQRYYFASDEFFHINVQGPIAGAPGHTQYGVNIQFPVTMRATPSTSMQKTTHTFDVFNFVAQATSPDGVYWKFNSNNLTSGIYFTDLTANAEL